MLKYDIERSCLLRFSNKWLHFIFQSAKQTDTRKFPVKSKDTVAQETKGFNQVEGFQNVGHEIDTNTIINKTKDWGLVHERQWEKQNVTQ